MSAIPYKTSRRYQIMLAIKVNDCSMTPEQIFEINGAWAEFKDVAACRIELWSMAQQGTLVQIDDAFALSSAAIRYLDGGESEVAEKTKAPLVAPAYVNIWTAPMKNYEASLRRGMRA